MAAPQYVYGDPNPQLFTVATAQAVEVGDMVSMQAGTLVRAQDVTWGTAIATPAAPTVANGAVAVGSPLTNALTNVKISYQFPWGEGALSAAGNATPTAAALLLVSGAPLVPPSPALYTNVYVETAAGSGVYKLWGISYGESVMVNSYGAGQVPAAGNPGGTAVLSDATTLTQWAFVSQAFAGISGQRKVAAQTTPYGSSIANRIRVDTEGVFEIDATAATYTNGQVVVHDYSAT